MNIIKKYFDIDAPNTESAATEQPSIAAMMAKYGEQTAGEEVATPVSIETEKKEEPKATETTTSDVSSKQVEKVEEVVQEISKVAEEPKVQETPQKEAQVQQVQTWQEVLKQQQPDTVLKELGFDEKLVGFVKDAKELDPKVLGLLQSYKDGTVTEYLKELTTDYSKMSAEEVMRHQLRQEYPKASEAVINALYEDEVVEKYHLDADRYDESEVEKGRLLLDARTERFRDALIAKQQQYLLPKPQDQKEVINDNSEFEQEKVFENYKREIEENSYTKSVFTTKQLVLGEGEDSLKYPIDNPNSLTDVLYDSDKWKQSIFSLQKDSNGNDVYVPDVEKQLFIAAAVKDYKGLVRDLIKHGKSLGGKTTIESIDNASNPAKQTATTSESAPKSIAEAMAKHGTVSSGGY